MLSDRLCLITVVSEGLLTSGGNTMLVVRRFGNVCPGTVKLIQLVSPSWNTDFGGLDMFCERLSSEFHIVHCLATLGLVGKRGEVVSV